MKKNKIVSAPRPEAPVPRSMEEINKVYVELCQRAGALQYRLKVEQSELEQLNEALLSVNNEGALRQQLDAKAKEESK